MPGDVACACREARRLAVYAGALIAGLATGTASAQEFSNKDGYAPDGSYRVQVELTPYLWLPWLNATVGLNRPAGTDISINRPRVTIADLASTLNGAFVAQGLVRYGPWSAELDFDWIAASQSKTFPALVGARQDTLNLHDSVIYVAPGFGYRIIPGFAPDTVSIDLRAGFSYVATSASASFDQSREGGADTSYDFVQPWLGFRADYYPSPRWRIELVSALTGLGVDGGVWGWNGRLSASYLITRWLDASLGILGPRDGPERQPAARRQHEGSARAGVRARVGDRLPLLNAGIPGHARML